MKPEAELQAACCRWFDNQYPQYTKFITVQKKVRGKIVYKVQRVSLLCCNANGGYRDIREARNLSKQGISVGVADLTLYVKKQNIPALLIELKARKGKQSEAQTEFQKLAEAQGYQYALIFNFDDFKTTIENYLIK